MQPNLDLMTMATPDHHGGPTNASSEFATQGLTAETHAECGSRTREVGTTVGSGWIAVFSALIGLIAGYSAGAATPGSSYTVVAIIVGSVVAALCVWRLEALIQVAVRTFQS